MSKYNFKEYLGQMVRIELDRCSGHTVHIGIFKGCKGNYMELLTKNGRTIWCKKPICYYDTIEVLEDGLKEQD